MARFGNVADLATFLGKLDADYAEYAPALWQKGIKTPRQLANFSEPHYLACDVPEGHIDDIKARADTTGSPQRAVDKTSRKIAQLAQLVGSPPPGFEDLEAFLFEHSVVKLPVLDAKYYSLIAANELSGAEALAEVVTVALRMQYEPVEDEITLAGVQAMALFCRA